MWDEAKAQGMAAQQRHRTQGSHHAHAVDGKENIVFAKATVQRSGAARHDAADKEAALRILVNLQTKARRGAAVWKRVHVG